MTKRAAFISLSALAIAALQSGCGDKPLTYQTDIKPILEANCMECHVPGGKGFEKAGLRMDSHEALMKGTKFGAVIVPGSSVSSTLYRLVSGQADPSIRMPHGEAELSADEVSKVGAWIDQGAK